VIQGTETIRKYLKPEIVVIKRRRNESCFANGQELGYLKSARRLGRNSYKGLQGDAINAMLASAAFNFKRAKRVLLLLMQKILLGGKLENSVVQENQVNRTFCKLMPF
jgi:hypothetical protein